MWRSRQARFVLMLIGAGCLWIGLIGWASRHFGGERLLLSRGEVDMGVLPPNSRQTARVWVFNLTGRTVEVRAEASCGCTVADLQKSALLPVDGMPIEIAVDTTGRSPRRLRHYKRSSSCGCTWIEDTRFPIHIDVVERICRTKSC
ncbi:MAG: hypothetical protein KatS3mg021_1250 [Fimbriimonadales bacterium]|nr:MAG: hypothetical protein KatS3mg021_1250 [Fimbriimonadales bacterium]